MTCCHVRMFFCQWRLRTGILILSVIETIIFLLHSLVILGLIVALSPYRKLDKIETVVIITAVFLHYFLVTVPRTIAFWGAQCTQVFTISRFSLAYVYFATTVVWPGIQVWWICSVYGCTEVKALLT